MDTTIQTYSPAAIADQIAVEDDMPPDLPPRFPWYELTEWAGHKLGLCSMNSWSEKLADAMFVDCPCCLLWRGIFLGLFTGSALTAASIGLWAYWSVMVGAVVGLL